MMIFGKNFKRGIDISPHGIRWVELKGAAGAFASSETRSVEVPEGLIRPSFAKENISDRDMLRSLILEAIPAGKRSGEIGLSIPDQLVKISSVEFEDLPAKKSEVERLISWKMKKSLPLSPEKMKVDFSIIGSFEAKVEVLAAIASIAAVREYEDVLRETGLRPAVVNMASLNGMALFREKLGKDAIFANISGSVTAGIALLLDEKLVAFRSKDFDGDAARLGKEVLSTLTYYQGRNPDISVEDIYLLGSREVVSDVQGELVNNFDGTVHRLSLKDCIADGEIDEEFAPAAGAAMRS